MDGVPLINFFGMWNFRKYFFLKAKKTMPRLGVPLFIGLSFATILLSRPNTNAFWAE